MLRRVALVMAAFVSCAVVTLPSFADDALPLIECSAARHGQDVVLQLRVPADQPFELYADRLRVRLAGGATSDLVDLKAITPTYQDRELGHIVVRERAAATLHVPARVASLEVTYQGCDPVHGLCYLPQTTTVQIH